MRRVGIVAAGVLLVLATASGPAVAGSTSEAGEEAAELDSASQWFVGQREAPNAAVNPDAYAALQAQAAALPVAAGTWSERTARDYFTDSPTYAPIGATCGGNCDQNSGSGERYVSGRMTALA